MTASVPVQLLKTTCLLHQSSLFKGLSKAKHVITSITGRLLLQNIRSYHVYHCLFKLESDVKVGQG